MSMNDGLDSTIPDHFLLFHEQATGQVIAVNRTAISCVVPDGDNAVLYLAGPSTTPDVEREGRRVVVREHSDEVLGLLKIETPPLSPLPVLRHQTNFVPISSGLGETTHINPLAVVCVLGGDGDDRHFGVRTHALFTHSTAPLKLRPSPAAVAAKFNAAIKEMFSAPE